MQLWFWVSGGGVCTLSPLGHLHQHFHVRHFQKRLRSVKNAIINCVIDSFRREISDWKTGWTNPFYCTDSSESNQCTIRNHLSKYLHGLTLPVLAKTSFCPLQGSHANANANDGFWFGFRKNCKKSGSLIPSPSSRCYVLSFASVLLSVHRSERPDRPRRSHDILLFCELCFCSRVFRTSSASSPPSDLYISNYRSALQWPRCRYTVTMSSARS